MNECVEESRPEFIELLEAFKFELSQMNENSEVIFQRLNMIKTFSEPKEAPPEKSISTGFISDFWECIVKMRDYNSQLKESRNALVKFIG